MIEADFNTYFKNSLMDLPTYFAHKLQDLGHGKGIKKPYDIFGEYKRGFIAVEGKKIKKLKAFNFNCFESQQISSLLHAYQNGHYSFVSLYVEIPRHSYCLLFCINLIVYLIKKNKKSILKKELQKFVESYAISLKKKRFDLEGYKDKIITIDKWKRMFKC